MYLLTCTILAHLPHKHKIVIAGNHELSFDKSFKHPFEREEEIPCLGNSRNKICEAFQSNDAREQLTNCTYLQVINCTFLHHACCNLQPFKIA